MSQIRKEFKTVNMKLDKSVCEKLDLFCEETGLSRTVATEKILNKFLSDFFRQPVDTRGLFQ